MRIVKIKLSSDYFQSFVYPDFFKVCSYIEIQKIFIQSASDFFSIQKIVLKPEYVKTAEQTIRSVFKPVIFQIIEQRGEDVLCIIKEANQTGFHPFLFNSDVAMIPPIEIDPESVKLSFIASEENLPKIIQNLPAIVKKYEIIAVTDAQSTPETIGQAYPGFTARQREIATYAFRNGFFESPKKITAEEIAAKFDISVSAVNDHVRKIEKIVMKYFFS